MFTLQIKLSVYTAKTEMLLPVICLATLSKETSPYFFPHRGMRVPPTREKIGVGFMIRLHSEVSLGAYTFSINYTLPLLLFKTAHGL